MTGCAERLLQHETGVPIVDPNLFVKEPRPRLRAGEASWGDLELIAERLRGGGERCYARLGGVRSVLEAAGMTPEERAADARQK